MDSPVSFERSWADYVNGFGDPEGDHWVGLGYASRQMGRRKHTMRVDLVAENGTEAHTVYYGFTLFETGTGGYKIRYDAIAPGSDAGESIQVTIASAFDFVAHLYDNILYTIMYNQHRFFLINGVYLWIMEHLLASWSREYRDDRLEESAERRRVSGSV